MNDLKQYIKFTWWRIKLIFYKPPKNQDNFIYEDEDK